MVKIREHQCEFGNPDNYQEREIVYSSWEKYKEDLKRHNYKQQADEKLFYPSIPRNTIIENIIEDTDKQFVFGFWNYAHHCYIIHKAEFIGEK